MPPFQYPKTRRVNQVDVYHGVPVADPYRWLEDDRSEETAAWVEAENQFTSVYLDAIPHRRQLKERLESLLNYPKYSAPYRRGNYYVFSKNDGLQNQNVLYIQHGLDAEPELLLDPNSFSEDGTTTLAMAAISRDGKYLAYGFSAGGSDWLEARVMEVATRAGLPDHLRWLKVTSIAWAGEGFFYS